MSLVNNCIFNATSSGTGAFVVSSAVTGYQTPANAGVVDGKSYHYRAQSADLSQWEEGTCVSSLTQTSFTRVVIASSAGGTTTVSFTAAPQVMLTVLAQDILQFDDAMTLTTAQQAQACANISVGNIPQNSQSANYTTVLLDNGKHIFHPSADTTARTFTIDSNANVAYPVGATLTFVNQHSAGVITIAITSDTMRLAGAGTTGSRTLAADGMATALKITTTEWIISGTGLT